MMPGLRKFSPIYRVTGDLRGHLITETINGEWVYMDDWTSCKARRNTCGRCGKPDTPEGHDGCLGNLPGVMNACCGHGVASDAYVQFWDGRILRRREALEYFVKARQTDTRGALP